MRMLSEVMSEKDFEAVQKYYRNEAVRARIAEFCGGEEFSCEYLVGFGESLARQGYRRPLKLADRAGLPGLMDEALDLFRSVWDTSATLAIWDVEYFNLDSWTGLYRNQLAHFELMEPTYRVIEGLHRRYDVRHLTDTTSSGYHFVSQIPFSSRVHAKLEAIGHPEKSLLQKYATVPGGDNKRRRPLPERDAKGYSGIGRLMEFLCHRVIRETRKKSPIPVSISDASAGHSERGREGMNLDITQYADPLYMRDIRTSFSTHQKHKVYVGLVGQETARKLPVYATVPRDRLSPGALFEIRSDLGRAAEYAAHTSSVIPDAAQGWERVIDDYRASPLYAFHQDFDSVEHDPPWKWPQTYRKLDLKSIPPCAANPIRNANPGLLVPTSIQTVCRVLFSYGWHPKHIGGLIRSHYEQPQDWGVNWWKYHAETRANFWARVYCGMLATGDDPMVDFNCVSHAGKGFCPSSWCGFNLEGRREAIINRVGTG
ncbi:MAG: hypothetical protein NTX71_02370 [Candidatus Aureabacteria bacterium]|nr:hypothetical protein [Candidatus Auribacterota bacterium]